jgi:hypothetical protein
LFARSQSNAKARPARFAYASIEPRGPSGRQAGGRDVNQKQQGFCALCHQSRRCLRPKPNTSPPAQTKDTPEPAIVSYNKFDNSTRAEYGRQR